jgi:hypothetical protein
MWKIILNLCKHSKIDHPTYLNRQVIDFNRWYNHIEFYTCLNFNSILHIKTMARICTKNKSLQIILIGRLKESLPNHQFPPMSPWPWPSSKCSKDDRVCLVGFMKSICWEKDKPKVFHIVTFLLLLSPNVQNLSGQS